MSDKIEMFIGVVVLLLLIGALASTTLSTMFNGTAYCDTFNVSSGACLTNNVPAWIPTALGTLGAIGFLYIIWRGTKK